MNMSDKQGGMIHFKLHNLYGSKITKEDFYKLQGLNADRKFTKEQASDLIDWLIELSESLSNSPVYEKVESRIRGVLAKY